MIDKYKQLILSDRSYFMGMAMIMVVCYHFVCWIGYGNVLFPLRFGYIGVDIFLFFSGIGLCFSYNKYDYKDFIKRRLARILPLYMLCAVIDTAIRSRLNVTSYSLWDWFCNVSSLSYYCVGGYLRDWYLSGLLLLYVTFPIAYRYVNKYKWGGVILTVIVSLALIIAVYAMSGKNMHFEHNCLISRLSIFLLGIMTYRYYKASNSSSSGYDRILLIALFIGIALLVVDFLSPLALGFVATAFIAPSLVIGLAAMYCHIGTSLLKVVRFVGKYSLEFYIANLIVYFTIQSMTHPLCKIVYYFAGNLLLALILIPVNKAFTQLLHQKIKNESH